MLIHETYGSPLDIPQALNQAEQDPAGDTVRSADEGEPCGPKVQLPNNSTVTGHCEVVTGGECGCDVDNRCPSAAAECANGDQEFFCCCYLLVQPPDVCYDNAVASPIEQALVPSDTATEAAPRSRARKHHRVGFRQLFQNKP